MSTWKRLLLLPIGSYFAGGDPSLGSGGEAAQQAPGKLSVLEALSGDDDPLGMGAARATPEEQEAAARERQREKAEEAAAREVRIVDPPGLGTPSKPTEAAPSDAEPAPDLVLGEEVEPPPAATEAADLERLRSRFPGTPDVALKVIREQELRIAQTTAGAGGGESDSGLLASLTRTPQGRAALKAALVADPTPGGDPSVRPEAPPAGAPAVPDVSAVTKLLQSTDPDEHQKGVLALATLMEHQTDRKIRALVQAIKQRDEQQQAHQQQREVAEAEFSAMDRLLGSKWRAAYADSAIKTVQRSPGMSLAEAIVVNAARRGDLRTVERLSPKGQRERIGRQQHQEGASRGRSDEGSEPTPDQARLWRALGHSPSYARTSRDPQRAERNRALGMDD